MRGSLSVEEVASFMGKSKEFVRQAIENGSLPIGCYSRTGKKSSYYISPKRAEEWMGYKRDEENINNGFTTCNGDNK